MIKYFIGMVAVLALVGAGCATVSQDSSLESNTSVTGDISLTAPAREVSFDITGYSFAFSQDKITVKQGDKVTINFSSTQGFHDWVVDEFNARTKQVNPGENTSVTFVANKTGEYEFYCSVGSHRALGMVGKLIVEPTDGPNAEDNSDTTSAKIKVDAGAIIKDTTKIEDAIVTGTKVKTDLDVKTGLKIKTDESSNSGTTVEDKTSAEATGTVKVNVY